MTPSVDENHAGGPRTQSSSRSLSIARSPSSSLVGIPDAKFGSASRRFIEHQPIFPRSESDVSANPTAVSVGRSQSYGRSTSPFSEQSRSATTQSAESHSIIVRSFAPRVSIFTSSDTKDFLRAKGFSAGLSQVLRPFGERVQGNVIVRDGVGGSRAWKDFGVRFIDPGPSTKVYEDVGTDISNQGQTISNFNSSSTGSSTNTLRTMEAVIQEILETSYCAPASTEDTPYLGGRLPQRSNQTSQSHFHHEYLRTLLSSFPTVPHETFGHPVACLIAVTSHNKSPIEALRQMYAQTSRDGAVAPLWMSTDYLRYYVLVHDEENGDIAKSTALFELMKRHFGLHCHLLRLRASECLPTDDDSTLVPQCEWLPAQEKLAEMKAEVCAGGIGSNRHYLVESDVAAIHTLIREMVTQSVVPFMETRIMTWNDQVASRRRGISGRFMSLSKRWTAYGSSSKGTGPGSELGSTGPGSTGSTHYNPDLGCYLPDSPESIMRQLADYSFMLRDWRSAHGTYELMRSDFGHDKAWAFHAAANEMAAVTSLLLSAPQSKIRNEPLHQLLDDAVYSYVTRCSLPLGAIRCLTVAAELLRDRGPTAADHAVSHIGRLLELEILTPNLQALTAERLADCYMFAISTAAEVPASRGRQAGHWNVVAAISWARVGGKFEANHRLANAAQCYGINGDNPQILPFASMKLLWDQLSAQVMSDLEYSDVLMQGTTEPGGNDQNISVLAKAPVDHFASHAISQIEGEGFTFSNFE